MALVFTRKKGEKVIFTCNDEVVELEVVSITKECVKLAITANKEVDIQRDDRLKRFLGGFKND